jgi:hypothetical protein
MRLASDHLTPDIAVKVVARALAAPRRTTYPAGGRPWMTPFADARRAARALARQAIVLKRAAALSPR